MTKSDRKYGIMCTVNAGTRGALGNALRWLADSIDVGQLSHGTVFSLSADATYIYWHRPTNPPDQFGAWRRRADIFKSIDTDPDGADFIARRCERMLEGSLF